MPDSDVFVGIDLGTSGCRAVAIDGDAQVLAQSRRPLPPSRHPGPGMSEQQPEDWWGAVCDSLRELVAQRPGRIRAVSVDATSSTLLLCDHTGRPLTPALMYDDQRALQQAQLIGRYAPTDSPARGPGSALSKMLCLQQGKTGEQAAHALHQADWINGRLCGRYGIADENNVLKLGYDPSTRSWPTWLRELPVRRTLLPRVSAVGTPIGHIPDDIAKQLGLPKQVLLIAGTTDSNAATLAAGARAPGDAVTSLGSTLVLKTYSTQPLTSAKYGISSHRIGDYWLTGGASNTGGAVLRKFFSDEEIVRLSREIDPMRPLGFGYYPLPGIGERFPRSAAQMQPVLEPRPDHPRDFLQGILEGIAAVEAEGYARLAELGAPYPTRVYSSGGGAVNETWRRIRERCLGIPVLRAAHTEAAYGSALLARSGAWASAGNQPQPDP